MCRADHVLLLDTGARRHAKERALTLRPLSPPPTHPEIAPRTAPPPRRRRSCPGACSCRRASPLPVGLGWPGFLRHTPKYVLARLGHAQRQPRRLGLCCRAPPRSSAAAPLQLFAPSPVCPLRRSRDAQRCLLGGGEAAQVHFLGTALHPRLIGLGPAGLVGDAEVARLALGREQRQPLRLRLLLRLHARQRYRRRSPLRRYCLPLRRSRDAQRRLLGGGEAAQVHLLAAAPHLRLIGLGVRLGPAGQVVHTKVARAVLGHEQCQPLRLRLLPRLLARQRYRRGSPLRGLRLPLWRPRDAQRRLLCGGEVAQVHVLATARHPRLIGLVLAGPVEAHAEVARLALAQEQCQLRRLRLLPRTLAR
eukprot:scaffold113591_cov55-Phaeocystis_antarctica.AAC.3